MNVRRSRLTRAFFITYSATLPQLGNWKDPRLYRVGTLCGEHNKSEAIRAVNSSLEEISNSKSNTSLKMEERAKSRCAYGTAIPPLAICQRHSWKAGCFFCIALNTFCARLNYMHIDNETHEGTSSDKPQNCELHCATAPFLQTQSQD